MYALFRTCTQGVWNTLVAKLADFTLESITEEGMKFFYQVRAFFPHLVCIFFLSRLHQLRVRCGTAWVQGTG